MIILRHDSDNFAHSVMAQQQTNSCAVASIWMARNQAFQMTVNECEWALAWSIYGQVVQRIPGALHPAPPPAVCLDPASHPPNQ